MNTYLIDLEEKLRQEDPEDGYLIDEIDGVIQYLMAIEEGLPGGPGDALDNFGELYGRDIQAQIDLLKKYQKWAEAIWLQGDL